jgi:hypothetical protein
MERLTPKLIKDITDIASNLNELRAKSRSFSRKIIGLGFDYQNKISGKVSNDFFYEIRDSISYRLSSCEYLFHLLNKHQGQDESDLTQSLSSQHGPGVFQIFGPGMSNVFAMASIERPCLFDSIIYHLTSTFDYMGGLTELICGGEGRHRLKWNSLVGKIRGGSPKHTTSLVAETVIAGHNNFVNSLYGHRSTLIHDSADIGGFEYIIDDKMSRATLHLFVTKKFLKEFPELKAIGRDYKITLRYAAIYLMTKTVDLLVEILLKLRQDIEINRKVPKGNEITFLKDKDGKFIDVSTPYWI